MLHVKCQSSTDPFQLATLQMDSVYVLCIYRRPTKSQRSCWSRVQLLWTISKSTMLLHFMDLFQWNWTTPVKLWISDTKVKWLQLVEFFFIDTESFPSAELKYYHPTLCWQKTIQAWNLLPWLPISYTSSIPSPYWMTLSWLCMYSVWWEQNIGLILYLFMALSSYPEAMVKGKKEWWLNMCLARLVANKTNNCAPSKFLIVCKSENLYCSVKGLMENASFTQRRKWFCKETEVGYG